MLAVDRHVAQSLTPFVRKNPFILTIQRPKISDAVAPNIIDPGNDGLRVSFKTQQKRYIRVFIWPGL